jgi:hypothetical protein
MSKISLWSPVMIARMLGRAQRCPACGSDDLEPSHGMDGASILICRHCKHQMSPEAALENGLTGGSGGCSGGCCGIRKPRKDGK